MQDLTLGELARIALGTTELGPANIAVLHSLIDLLLKKLDCRDEKVSIGGYESRCLRKLLESTKIPSLAFQEDNLEILASKFERVNALEQRVEAVNNRLERHFQEIRRCNRENNEFKHRNWDRYANTCEDLCVSCEPENRIACELIKNADFMKKMLRRISKPLVDRMFSFETQIESLHNDFEKFMEKTSEHYLKMALVERCIQEIEHLRHQVDENHLQFLGAMEEVQDMFDAKLDKIHLPALKKYVRDRFDAIEGSVEGLRKPPTCPEAAGVIMNGVKCLSCGNEKVCTEKSIVIKGVMPESAVKNRPKILKKYCGCQYPPTGVVTEHMLEFAAPGRAVRMVNIADNAKLQKSCKSLEGNRNLKPGKNGMLYRMDPTYESLQEENEKK